MLYQHFSTPSGLEEWFADKANSRGKIITFFWDDSEEQALVISKIALKILLFLLVDGRLKAFE